MAAFSTEIISGRLFSRKLLDEAVVLYRAMDRRVVALEDRCPHRFTPLSKGTLIGDTLRCGYHGLCFGNEAVAESPASTRSEGHAVYVAKEMKSCLPPPFYQYLARISGTDAIDRWQAPCSGRRAIS